MERTDKHISIYFNDELIADTRRAWRVLETSHPPVYYIPPEDIRSDYLVPAPGGSWCEWKGQATYFDIMVGEKTACRAAWSYPNPTQSFASIKDKETQITPLDKTLTNYWAAF